MIGIAQCPIADGLLLSRARFLFGQNKDNNIIYKSANDASKKLNLYPSAIIGVCKGTYNHTNNFKFKFVEDEK